MATNTGLSLIWPSQSLAHFTRDETARPCHNREMHRRPDTGFSGKHRCDAESRGSSMKYPREAASSSPNSMCPRPARCAGTHSDSVEWRCGTPRAGHRRFNMGESTRPACPQPTSPRERTRSPVSPPTTASRFRHCRNLRCDELDGSSASRTASRAWDRFPSVWARPPAIRQLQRPLQARSRPVQQSADVTQTLRHPLLHRNPRRHADPSASLACRLAANFQR